MVIKSKNNLMNKKTQPNVSEITIDDIKTMSKKQLYSLSTQINLQNRSTMKKRELYKAIIEYIKRYNITSKKLANKTITSNYPKPETGNYGTRETGIFIDWGLPIPDHYCSDRVVAMVRDPYWIFIYWEIEGNNGKKTALTYSEDIIKKSFWILRVEFIDDGIREDIPIMPNYKSWYLQVNPNNRYQAKIGLLTPDNIFITIASSQVIKTPLAYPSDNIESEWSINDDKFKEMMKSIGIDLEKECWSFAGSSPRHWSPSFLYKKNQI